MYMGTYMCRERVKWARDLVSVLQFGWCGLHNKLRQILVTAWTLHATHTIQPLGQIRDLVPILPPPYPI